MSPAARFFALMLGLDAVGLVAVTAVAPPDPVTQLYYAVPVLVASPLVAFWAVYVRGGGPPLSAALTAEDLDGERDGPDGEDGDPDDRDRR